MIALALTGHLGAQVADLVDGRLPAHLEERAWQHVLACAGCRARVEAEGWAKQALGGLRNSPYGTSAPIDVLGQLHEIDDYDAVVGAGHGAGRTLRRASLALVGAGSLGAAVLGLAALTAPTTVPGDAPGGPASILRGLTQAASPAAGPVSDRGTAGPADLRRTPK